MRIKFLALLLFAALNAGAQIDPFTYKGGKVHVSGKLTSSNPEVSVPKLTVFYFSDLFCDRDMHTQVDIADDGTFIGRHNRSASAVHTYKRFQGRNLLPARRHAGNRSGCRYREIPNRV